MDRSLGYPFLEIGPTTKNTIYFRLLFSVWQIWFKKIGRTSQWETPYADNLSSNISWGRQSNAFGRFIGTAAIYWFLSNAPRQSSSSLSSVVWRFIQLYTGFYLMLHVNLLVVLAVWSDGSFPFTQLNNNRYFRSTNKKNNFLKIHTKIVYNVPLMIYYINWLLRCACNILIIKKIIPNCSDYLYVHCTLNL
jgi:hypothetical protein